MNFHSFLRRSISLVMIICVFTSAGFTQSSESDDNCSQFSAALDDARNGFTKYMGENSSIGYEGTIVNYKHEMWGSASAQYVEDYLFGGAQVDYIYQRFNNQAEAKTLFNSLDVKLKECLPETYKLASEKQSGTNIYKQYESEQADFEDPIIIVRIEESGQSYLVKISFTI